ATHIQFIFYWTIPIILFNVICIENILFFRHINKIETIKNELKLIIIAKNRYKYKIIKREIHLKNIKTWAQSLILKILYQ
ncbi:MAG: hypothetical protein ACTSWR_08675, partial [Candidatus Helarchaeota archaeon]